MRNEPAASALRLTGDSCARYAGFLNGVKREKTLAVIREALDVPPKEETTKVEPERLDMLGDSDFEEFQPETTYPRTKCGLRNIQWAALILAVLGWAAYTALMPRTLPRCVLERLEREGKGVTIEWQLPELHPTPPP